MGYVLTNKFLGGTCLLCHKMAPPLQILHSMENNYKLCDFMSRNEQKHLEVHRCT